MIDFEEDFEPIVKNPHKFEKAKTFISEPPTYTANSVTHPKRVYRTSTAKYIKFNMYNHDLEFFGTSKASTLFKEVKNINIDRYGASKRGKVINFSSKSKLRLLKSIRNTDCILKSFVTLTYPRKFASNGRLVKQHFNNFLTQLRKYYGNFNYAWVLEFQKRGAPHFHIIIDKSVKILTSTGAGNLASNTSFMSEIWYNIVNSGDSRHLRYGVDIQPVTDPNTFALASYFSKYMTKEGQKDVPFYYRDVGRFWGVSRSFTVVKNILILRSEDAKFFIKVLNHYYRLRQEKNRYLGTNKSKSYRFKVSGFIFDSKAIFSKVLSQVRLHTSITLDDFIKDYNDALEESRKNLKFKFTRVATI